MQSYDLDIMLANGLPKVEKVHTPPKKKGVKIQLVSFLVVPGSVKFGSFFFFFYDLPYSL